MLNNAPYPNPFTLYVRRDSRFDQKCLHCIESYCIGLTQYLVDYSRSACQICCLPFSLVISLSSFCIVYFKYQLSLVFKSSLIRNFSLRRQRWCCLTIPSSCQRWRTCSRVVVKSGPSCSRLSRTMDRTARTLAAEHPANGKNKS